MVELKIKVVKKKSKKKSSRDAVLEGESWEPKATFERLYGIHATNATGEFRWKVLHEGAG